MNKRKAHPDTAKAYADLKYELIKKFGQQRVEYRIAKTDFVTDVTTRAKAAITSTQG